MDKESTVKLIKLVEMQPFLYNGESIGISKFDRKVKDAWEKIKYELNIPEIDPMKIWKRIRINIYSATLYRIVKKDPTIPPCQLEKELLFILPYLNFPKRFRNDAILYIQSLFFIYQCNRNEIVQTYNNKTEYCNFIQENKYQQHVIDNLILGAPLTINSLSVVQPYKDTGLYYNQYASVTKSPNNLSNYWINDPKIQNQIIPNYSQSNVIEPNYVSYPTQINTSLCNASDASAFYYPTNTIQIFNSINSSYLPATEEPSYASHSLQWNTRMPSATQHNHLTYLPEQYNQTFFTLNPSYTEINTLPYSNQLN